MAAPKGVAAGKSRMCSSPLTSSKCISLASRACRGLLAPSHHHPRPSTAAYSSSRGAHELVDWVSSQGGSVNGVAPANLAGRDGGSGWGLKATQDLAAGSRLVELPSSCQLTYSSSSTDPRLMGVIQQVPEELWGGRLALQVLAQRLGGADSHFAPYIHNLPLGVEGVPLFFSGPAIEALDYPPVVEQVKKRGRWLARFTRDVLAQLLPEADPFGGTGSSLDVNALGWALAVVTSRAFRLRGLSAPASLLPLIDMANHSFSPNAEVVLVGEAAVMRATQEVAAGSPLLLNYGKLGNDFLLLDYGFIIPGNPHDRVALRFDIGLLQDAAIAAVVKEGSGLFKVKLTPWKEALLKQLRLAGPGADLQVQVGGPQHVSPRFLAAVRILAAQYAIEVDGRTLEELGDWDRPLNKANEGKTLRLLSGSVLVALSNFKTSLPEDLDLLEQGSNQQQLQQDAPAAAGGSSSSSSGSLSEEMKMAIGFRVEMKKVLVGALQGLTRRIKEVAAMPELKEAAVVPAVKGQKPRAATSKGFGSGSSGRKQL